MNAVLWKAMSRAIFFSFDLIVRGGGDRVSCWHSEGLPLLPAGSGVRFTWWLSVTEVPTYSKDASTTVEMGWIFGVLLAAWMKPREAQVGGAGGRSVDVETWCVFGSERAKTRRVALHAWRAAYRGQARDPPALVDAKLINEGPGSHTHERFPGVLEILAKQIIRFLMQCFCFWRFSQDKENNVMSAEVDCNSWFRTPICLEKIVCAIKIFFWSLCAS